MNEARELRDSLPAVPPSLPVPAFVVVCVRAWNIGQTMSDFGKPTLNQFIPGANKSGITGPN
jgi:hypothetical protein